MPGIYPLKDILIVGAGSTGLSSALFLSEAGYKPRIIEKRKEISGITKALGVNPNTLRLLEASGVTKRFLQNGYILNCFNFWHYGKLLYRNDLSKVKHPYPFMLIQPQCDTENIIEETLLERNIRVERNTELISLNAGEKITNIELRNESGAIEHINTKGLVIGADGHKSKVREYLDIEFRGWEHQEKFSLYDIELDTPLSPKEGHYLVFKEGGMIMLYIRDGIWRVGGNVANVFERLPKGTRLGKISWETHFTVREKMADRFSISNTYLLGDAAHIHSPIGAKGMNLCIEDSFIFSEFVKQGKEKDFHAMRYPQIKKNIGVLSQITDKIGGNHFLGRTLRGNMDKLKFIYPLTMPLMRKFLLGIK